jgi:hypothetical protein
MPKRAGSVKQPRPEGSVHPDHLLHMWMGDPEKAPKRRRSAPTGLVVAGSLVTLAALALMAKFAVDVLGIVLALAAVGIALHVLGIRLAESDILSPGWLLIILLGVALFAYAFFVPAESVAGLGRYMPRWMVAGLEWSEQHGWAGRALGGPGGGGTAPVSVEPAAPARGADSAPSSSSPAPNLVVTLSSAVVTRGQPVTLMARSANRNDGANAASVRFYDGGTLLGAADTRAEGRARMAYLTVRGLAAGTHEIRAESVGPLGGRGGLSEPVRLTVVGR